MGHEVDVVEDLTTDSAGVRIGIRASARLSRIVHGLCWDVDKTVER